MSTFMLSFRINSIILSVIKLNVIIMSVTILGVIMLHNILPNTTYAGSCVLIHYAERLASPPGPYFIALFTAVIYKFLN